MTTTRDRWAQAGMGLLGLVLAAGLWEILTASGAVDPDTVPSLTAIADALVTELGQNSFWTALGRTLASTGLGLAISVAIALPLGTALGLSPRAFRSTRFVAEFLKPIPVVAILPLVLLIYGTTLQMKLVLIVFGTVWPLLIQVLYGVQAVDPVVASTARSYRLGPVQRILRVVLPSASPMIATGLRVAATTALILSIVAELVGGAPGLGAEISRAQTGGNYARLYALVVVTGVLGLALNFLVEWPERRVMHWHPSHRGEVNP